MYVIDLFAVFYIHERFILTHIMKIRRLLIKGSLQEVEKFSLHLFLFCKVDTLYRVFFAWVILAKMTRGRCVKISPSPIFRYLKGSQLKSKVGFIFRCVYFWRFQGSCEISEN